MSIFARKAALRCGGAVIALFCASAAWAQTRSFDVPPQRAVDSIPEFARQAGVQIVAPADQLAGLKTGGIKGNLDVRTALTELLRGTGLQMASNDGQTILLRNSRKNAVATPTEGVGSSRSEVEKSQGDSVEEVTVTGYAASLQKATEAKRNSTNFSESVFAEDIGKFPDTNLAESLNRIPGVTIARDVDGQGVNVSIRGLGTNFTKVTLNGANIAVATTGTIDQSNNNREVDLNMFPAELFTQLTVSKSASADLLEGGAAGNVNLRSARPFDKEGFRVSYNLQGTNYDNATRPGERGALIVSDTWGGFGALIGFSGAQNNFFTKGWEDGAGWGTLGPLNASQCPAANCDGIGADLAALPATVPANVTTGGLVPGQAVNVALLQQLNPGLTPQQISNTLFPRLGRPMYEGGSRDRYNGIVSLEWRPADSLHFYFDAITGRSFNDYDRSDMSLGVRAGAGSTPVIPENIVQDPGTKSQLNNIGGVAQSVTFANASFFLEAVHAKEKNDFFSLNPGGTWQINDLMKLDFQVNASRSHYFRVAPTFIITTCPSAGQPTGVSGCAAPAGGVYANISNPTGATIPTITTNIDLNNPNNFNWSNGGTNGAARLATEKRYTQTSGAHADFTWGGDRIALHTGLAYDSSFRAITGSNADQQFQTAACGEGLSPFLPPGNSTSACRGLAIAANSGSTAANIAAVNAVAPGSVPAYSGYGTGYSAGFPALTFAGSGVPQSTLASFLRPGPIGFVSANFDGLQAASGFNTILPTLSNLPNSHAGLTESYPFSLGSGSAGNSGTLNENIYSWYGEVTGTEPIDGHNLRYNLGLRFVESHQYITSPITVVDPRNATGGAGGTALLDGGLYPNTYKFSTQSKEYGSFLPSLNLVYEVTDNFQVRGALSRTMTRANPNFMISGVNFTDFQAQGVALGNPALKPFYSNNIDVGAEFYTGGAGYIGFTAFRKSLAGYPVQQNVTQPFSYLAQFGINYTTVNSVQQTALAGRGCTSDANCSATVTVTQQVNAPGLLTVNGMEIDYVQPLDFLLGQWGLEGFGFNGNLTILDQKSSGSAPAFATGVAPLGYNVTGYYEHNGISLRLSYVYTDTTYASASNQQSLCLPNISTAAAGCPGGAYLFRQAYGQTDLSTSVALSKIFGEIPSDPELTFDVQNLFHAKQRTYDQFLNAPHGYYDQGQVILLGLRGTF